MANLNISTLGKFTGVKFTNGTYDYIISSPKKRNLLSINSDYVYIVTILDGSWETWKKTEKEVENSFNRGRWQKIN